MTSEWETGALVVDTGRDKVGRVMGYVGTYVQLRPPGGGREWDADPARVRPADEDERLRANVAELSLTTRGRPS